MFDIAFSEMLVIAVVALIVIGPEKLPKFARTLGLMIGRVQRYVSDVKSDIDRELQAQELQKLQQDIKQSTQRIQGEAALLKAELGSAANELHTAQQDLALSINNASMPVAEQPEVSIPPDSKKQQ